mmetsp:Transcript_15953/g.33182  ORF Transcript_15953/g.33182 Transcript_15953/m.33182 type:complete len:233 (+) Transcript_15953:621-1319(+)
MAAAEDMATCNTTVLKNTADEATTNGRISVHFGSCNTGVTVNIASSTFLVSSPPSSFPPCVLLRALFEPISPSALGNFPPNTPKNTNAAIHSAVVVAIPAPIGPIPNCATNTTSNTKFTAFDPNNTNVGVLASKYPLKIPLDALHANTAGAASALTVKNSSAYRSASGPVAPVPMTCSKGALYSKSAAARTLPRTKARPSAWPPTKAAPASSPRPLRLATRGAVAVARKLKT